MLNSFCSLLSPSLPPPPLSYMHGTNAVMCPDGSWALSTARPQGSRARHWAQCPLCTKRLWGLQGPPFPAAWPHLSYGRSCFLGAETPNVGFVWHFSELPVPWICVWFLIFPLNNSKVHTDCSVYTLNRSFVLRTKNWHRFLPSLPNYLPTENV